MAFQKPKLTLSEVSQTFDLEELTGVDLSGRSDIKLAIGQAILDRIEERTQDENVDIRGREFKAYKPSYINSDTFKDFKDGTDVDMTLRGRMLQDMDIISSSGNELKIGFTDDLEIKKAYNHNTGDTVRKRQFFGVLKKDIDEIIEREFKAELKEVKRELKEDSSLLADLTTTALVTEAESIDLGDLFGGLFGEGDL